MNAQAVLRDCRLGNRSAPKSFSSTSLFQTSHSHLHPTLCRHLRLLQADPSPTHHNKELKTTSPTMSFLQSDHPRSPTSPEISTFLSTRSGCEMVQLLQSMQDPTAQAALTTALLFGPPVESSRATEKTSEKAKKALNAFVGFRCRFHDRLTCRFTNTKARLLHRHS